MCAYCSLFACTSCIVICSNFWRAIFIQSGTRAFVIAQRQNVVSDIFVISFSALTAFYTEDVLSSTNDLKLNLPNGDGISVLHYLIKIFPGSPLPFSEQLISSLTIISVGKTDMLPHKMVIYYR